MHSFMRASLVNFAIVSVLLLALTFTPRAEAYTQADLKTGSDSTIEVIPLEATGQESPASINIKTYAPGTFTIYRKSPSVSIWGTPVASGVTLGIEGVWSDPNVTVGTLYEYRFVNTAGTQVTGSYPCGYILCGIKVDQTQPRGRMAVVVTPEVSVNLPAEYAQYKTDLIGDGWAVSEIVVPRAVNLNGIGNGSIASVKVNAGGTGFVNSDVVSLTNAAGKKAVGKITAPSGIITSVSIPAGAGGAGFAVNDVLTISGGSSVGSGATLRAHVDATQSTMSYASPVAGGTGYTDGQSVTLTGQTSGKTAQCTLRVFSGAVSSFTFVSAQSGFILNEPLTMTGNTTGAGLGPLIVGYLSSGAFVQGSVYIRPPGTGYLEGDSITLTGVQSGKTAQAEIHLSGAYISYVTIVSSQAGFIQSEALTLSGGSGTGAGAFTCSSITAPLMSVVVAAGGTGYVNGNVVTIKYGSGTAEGVLSVTSGAITAVSVTSSTTGFFENGTLSLSGLQTTATGYSLAVLTVDNSNTGRAVLVGSGGSGYLDNDSVTLKGNTSGATTRTSIIAPGGVVSQVSAVLPNTFTPGESITILSATSGSGFTATAGPSGDNHLLIRSAIQGVYNAYPGELKNIVVIGRVTAPRSGINDGYGSDGHWNRAPYGSDAFFADMDGVVGVDWTDLQDNTSSAVENYNLPGDKQFDQQKIGTIGNGQVELGYGRIDLSVTTQTETEALRTYFNKLHRYKIASADFRPGRAVIDRYGFANERETNLQSMPGVVGMSQIKFTKTTDLPNVQGGQDADALYSAQNGPYLFYFKGSGGPSGSVGSKAVFWTGMQSHWGYWYTNNTMAARLGEDNFTLSYTWNIWGLRYIYHRLGMGLDAGDMMKQSINNRGWASGPYNYRFSNTNNGDFHGVLYMNHMGDPALRLFMVEPPTRLSVVQQGSQPALSWTASPDASVVGYHVYRAANASAPFARLTATPQTGTTYTDTAVNSGAYTYMVRAIRLETSGGGTYYNPSLGTMQSLDLNAAPTAVSVVTASVPAMSWNTAITFLLTAQGGVPQYDWSLIAGSLPSGLTLSATGALSGTPTAVGTFPVTFSVTDRIGQTATQTFSIVVTSNSAAVIYPVATTYTNKQSPTTSYGTVESGLVTGNATNMYETFHRYDLSGVPLNNGFAKATLYLYVTSGTTAGAYAPVMANLIADGQDGWVDNGIAKPFSGYVNNGSNKVRINCPAHGFLSGTQVTIAGLTGTNAPVGPYAVTVIDANTFDLPVTYSSAWAYDPAYAFATTVSTTYDTRPTAYNPNVPTVVAQGTDTAGTYLRIDVTPFVRETLLNDPAKKMSIRFFTGTPQTVATGTLRAFGAAVPYLVLETTDAPKIEINSPGANPVSIRTGSSVLLDSTVTPLPGRTASLLWTKVSGPGSVTFSAATTAKTSANFSLPGDYILRLTANDGIAESFRDLTIRVLNEAITGPTDSMVLRLALDETSGTLAQDVSGVTPSNNGTLISTPTSNPLPAWTSAGQISGGLSFAGAGQRVDVPDSTSNLLDGLKQMSVSVWFKAAALPVTPNYAAIVSKRLGSFNKESYILQLRGNTGATSALYFYIAGGTSQASNTQFVPGQWYHAVMVYDGNLTSNNLQLWVNGSPDKFATITPVTVPRNPTGNLHIGSLDTADTLGFNGTIDELRIYNRALTLTEIQDLYAATPPNVGPVVSTSATLSGMAGQPLNLSASVVDDGHPTPTMTYSWSLLNGPGVMTIAAPGSLTTTGLPAVPGTYLLQFSASDGSITTTTNILAAISGQTFDTWAASHGLTGGNALPTAILTGDGLTNFQKYAWGLDPLTTYPPGSAGLPKTEKQAFGGFDYLALTFNGTASDVTYIVQVRSDLASPWSDLQTYAAGSPPGIVTVRDSSPMKDFGRRFMRLQISKP